jgi:hypothetical protein
VFEDEGLFTRTRAQWVTAPNERVSLELEDPVMPIVDFDYAVSDGFEGRFKGFVGRVTSGQRPDDGV